MSREGVTLNPFQKYVIYNLGLFLEFANLGQTFPGKLSPRSPMIEPRRMNLPPDFADDWKKIGSKRSKFDDLGLPLPVDRFPRHKTIYIKEAATSDRKQNC